MNEHLMRPPPRHRARPLLGGTAWPRRTRCLIRASGACPQLAETVTRRRWRASRPRSQAARKIGAFRSRRRFRRDRAVLLPLRPRGNECTPELPAWPYLLRQATLFDAMAVARLDVALSCFAPSGQR
jgi:hypothetical protein